MNPFYTSPVEKKLCSFCGGSTMLILGHITSEDGLVSGDLTWCLTCGKRWMPDGSELITPPAEFRLPGVDDYVRCGSCEYRITGVALDGETITAELIRTDADEDDW